MAQTPTTHPTAILKLPRRKKDVLTYAKAVVTAMTGNASFPTPAITLATLQANVAALDAAEAAVLSRTKGAKQVRDEKLAIVVSDLKQQRAYVQGVADANAANAESIINSAGMFVRTVTLHPKGDLVAKLGKVSGTVQLTAKSAARRASYEWQESLDQKTWTPLPVTLQSTAKVVGLTVGTVYFFRVRPVTKEGEGNWTQIVSVLVS